MNEAQQIINESQEQDWDADKFQEWLYHTPEEDQKKAKNITSFIPSFLNPSSSGDSPELNYNFKKDPLEELGIEVLK